MCQSPLYRIQDLATEKVFFAPMRGELDARKIYKPPRYILQSVPCANCMECRIEYSKQWAFRCMKEANEYEDNIMLTLTYDDEHIPKSKGINKETGEVIESYTLNKKDHQDFMKRLRKKFEPQKIRFYMCGEYGEKKGRPHYHIICFNLKVDDLKFHKWSNCDWSKEKNALYKSDTIQKIWGKGIVELNEVNYETCAYVARYVTKKIKGEKAPEYYETKGQLPEYTCMSRNPGIGEKYFEKNKEKFENGEKIWQKTKKKVLAINPGRYFDKLLEKESPEALEQLKKQRLEKSKEIMERILIDTTLNKDDYREQKEALNAKYQKLKRQFE